MEAVQFSTVASRHYSATGKTFYNSRISAGKSTKFVSSWAASSDHPAQLSSTSRNLFTVSTTKLQPSLFGSVLKKENKTISLFLSGLNCLQRETWGLINSKSVTIRRNGRRRLIVRAEMFGQLTSGLEAAWNKLKGEGLFFCFFNFIFFYENIAILLN